MKNLTNSKDRHWLIKENKQTGDIFMFIKYKKEILMEFPIPVEFLEVLDKLGYIEYAGHKSTD